jgi:kinesin family protein 22
LKEEEEKRLRLQQQQEEHLREREQEQEQEQEHSSMLHDRRSLSPQRDVSEPSIARGIITPLLQRHRDLDDELKGRLAKLEKKLYVRPPNSVETMF